MLARLMHRAYKIRTIGPKAAARVWYVKKKTRTTSLLWKRNTNWLLLVPKLHRLFLEDQFEPFYDQLTTNSFACMSSLYVTETREQVIAFADRYMRREISIFGSLPRRFEKIPWHTDVRLLTETPIADTQFNPTTFYADFTIPVHMGQQPAKDIRAVWELSRCNYLQAFGRAYHYTQDENYKRAFIVWVDDWITENKFLYGPNWVNAMEVSIRALNWIAAFEYFKMAKDLSLGFKKRFIQSLYQHMLYIEHNWEYYDARTNNHYLTNLISYLYLTHFFKVLPGCDAKFTWTVNEILREFDKQVFDEGASYEGSTHYHLLMTELCYLAYVLLQQLHMRVDMGVVAKLQRMISFLMWCTPYHGSLIKIGDDDSGAILQNGISYEKIGAILQKFCDEAPQVYSFTEFGLSIIKTQLWHVSLRHHQYRPQQPTGHFHNDVGSVTLSYNRIPIFVDPGSYVYTASSEWRNQFRSTFVHNSCFIVDQELVSLDQDLFALAIPAAESSAALFQDPTILGMTSQHGLYRRYGLLFERTVNLNIESNELVISDVCKSKIKQQPYLIGWNFTLDSQVQLYQESSGIWIVLHQQKPIMSISSPHVKLNLESGWMSPSYGVKVPVHRLRAATGIKIDTPFVIIIKACTS